MKVLIILLVSVLVNINSQDIPIDGLNYINYFLSLNETNNLLSNASDLFDKLPKSECTIQFFLYAYGLEQHQEWALKMLDATAKPQTGILAGNIMQLGHFDECVRIKEAVNGTTVQGKYCTATFNIKQEKLDDWIVDSLGINRNTSKVEGATGYAELKRSYGFCVPARCNADELQQIINVIEGENSVIHFQFTDHLCLISDAEPLSPSAIAAIVIFAIFISIIVYSTIFDMFVYPKLSNKEHFNKYRAFSIYTNFNKMVATRPSLDNLQCLNGIRVLSMVWVLVGHRFQNTFFLPLVNALDILLWVNDIKSTFIMAGILAVDTFFTVSGLLVVYSFLKGKRFSIVNFYVHRIIRLTPALAMFILFSGTLQKYLGSGPFWPLVYDILQKPCETNWWSTLLYVQNYVHTHNQCVGHAWYLAVDTQLYFLSPIFLLPLKKWPKISLSLMMLVSLLSLSYVFELSWKRGFISTYFDQEPDAFKLLYVATHVRASSYLIGMMCGYYIFQTKNKTRCFSKITVTLLWIFSIGVMLAVILSHYHFIRLDRNINLMETSFFNTLIRPGWSIGLCIMILLCIKGYGGIINRILSNAIFTVLIRLNYSIYLLHISVVVYFIGKQRIAGYFDDGLLFHTVAGDYVFTVVCAAIWFLAFEIPFVELEKLFIHRGKKKDTVEPNTSNTVIDRVDSVENGHVIR